VEEKAIGLLGDALRDRVPLNLGPGQLLKDPVGALSTLGEKANLSAEVNAFQSTDVGLGSASDLVEGDGGTEAAGEGVGISGVGNREVTTAFSRRTDRPLLSPSTSPGRARTGSGRRCGACARTPR
jgi:hypothetical protein